MESINYSSWEIIEDLIWKLIIKNCNNQVIEIPGKYRIEVKGMITSKCWKCLDNLIKTIEL